MVAGTEKELNRHNGRQFYPFLRAGAAAANDRDFVLRETAGA